MTIADFILELQKYPQDVHISMRESDDCGEVEFGEPEYLGGEPDNIIFIFDRDNNKTIWSKPETFKPINEQSCFKFYREYMKKKQQEKNYE